MGTFANQYKSEGVQIPPGKKEEFEQRLEKLFQAGGMMEVEMISMYGKTVPTIKKVAMHADGMNFYYNYFEDDVWENAGYNKEKGRVWSNKIGWLCFHITVVAAYTLEAFYLDGAAHPMVDGRFVSYEKFPVSAWLNYLFHENYTRLNHDPWKLYESLMLDKPDDYEAIIKDTSWISLTDIQNRSDLAGLMDVYAAEEGTDNFYTRRASEEKEKMEPFSLGKSMLIIKKLVHEFREKSAIPEEEQLAQLLGSLISFYKDGTKSDIELIFNIILFTIVSDIPAFFCRTLAEEYHTDFWELWGQIRDFVPEIRNKDIKEEIPKPIPPVTTKDFLGLKDDDMIPYWEPDGDIVFSEETEQWFFELKIQYDTLMEREVSLEESPLRWIMDILDFANSEFCEVFAFTNFWEETIEHLTDRRYLTLWELYDDMLHTLWQEQWGAETEESKEKIRRYWGLKSGEKRKNAARNMLRRYMALVANKKLRKKVFGF